MLISKIYGMRQYTYISYLTRSWWKNLRKHVKDPERQLNIYQPLHIMLEERCQSTFHQHLDNFLDKYRSDEPNFMQYFEEYYASRCGNIKKCTLVSMEYCIYSTYREVGNVFQKFWSIWHWYKYAYWKVSLSSCEKHVLDTTTCTTLTFSFHNQLKINPGYMDGKVNKRVDCLVHLLLKYEVDLFFNRQIKDLMWKYNRKEARKKQTSIRN